MENKIAGAALIDKRTGLGYNQGVFRSPVPNT